MRRFILDIDAFMNYVVRALLAFGLILGTSATWAVASSDATAAAPASSAASGSAADHAHAGARCEEAVAETVKRLRGHEAQDVEFIGAKRAIAPTQEEQLGVKGEGRYRGPGNTGGVAFSYSCAFNPQTGATSGVVLRETGSARSAAARPAWQPDLSTFTPDSCEAATAAALKDKYPRVSHIAFDSGTRQLRPANDQHTNFEGRGAMVRAPGMPAMPFGFSCEFETGNGKVVSVETHE